MLLSISSNLNPNWDVIMSRSDVLRNPQHELYAQGRVSGLSKEEAYKQAGFTGGRRSMSAIESRPEVQARMKQLLDNAARRAELSRKDILDRVFQDWELSRKLGQMSAALKAGHMLGSELHKMFVDRKEIGSAGDFDAKSEEELREIIKDGMKDLGWENDITPPPDKTLN